jgi:hypothetical protein
VRLQIGGRESSAGSHSAGSEYCRVGSQESLCRESLYALSQGRESRLVIEHLTIEHLGLHVYAADMRYKAGAVAIQHPHTHTSCDTAPVAVAIQHLVCV